MKIKVLRNQGIIQTLEKFQVLQTWIFFQFFTWIFFQVYGINLAFFLGEDLEVGLPRSKSRFAGPEIFLRFDFPRP